MAAGETCEASTPDSFWMSGDLQDDRLPLAELESTSLDGGRCDESMFLSPKVKVLPDEWFHCLRSLTHRVVWYLVLAS